MPLQKPTRGESQAAVNCISTHASAFMQGIHAVELGVRTVSVPHIPAIPTGENIYWREGKFIIG